MILDLIKKSEVKMIFGSLLTLVLGIVLTIAPDTLLKLLTCAIGIALMVFGIFSIISFFKLTKEERIVSGSLVIGFLIAMVGLYLFVNNSFFVNFITIIIGLVLALKGLYKIQFALNLKSVSDSWKYNLLIGILTLTVAVLLILDPFKGATTFLRIIGIILIVGSIIEIAESINIVKNLEKVKELPFEEKNEK